MATKGDSVPGGLLSRVVRFVRSPSANWGEVAQAASDRESLYSKQLLKEMIERKRRNDFVRKREFDMLRKMRRSEVLSGQDPGLRPSFFQSSMPSKPDDRATTLRKIDEIEAQMSMQWWKTKHGPQSHSSQVNSEYPALSQEALRAGAGSGQAAAPATSYARTGPLNLPAPATTSSSGSPSLLESVLPESSTQNSGPGSERNELPPLARPVLPTARLPVAPPQVTPAPQRPSRSDAVDGAPSVPTVFSPSRQLAIHVEEFAHDPELEEASIRFANGEDEGAEAGLLDVLGLDGARADHEETWLTLFDLYRAIGRQEGFETAAIEFANRFGRSAPQWFSLPEIVSRMNTPTATAVPAGVTVAHWNCPAIFGTQTLAALNAALNKGAPPYKLNWAKLNSIAEPAVEPLTRLFTQWARQSVQLRFMGAESLERVLKDATPSGDRSANPAWWKLRMEVLRVMHRPDEFELVALDYCVTYEVSPPSWDRSRCDYRTLHADGSTGRNTIIGEAFRDSLVSSFAAGTGFGDSQMPSMNSQLSSVVSVELSGQILGDGKEAIDTLDAKLAEADIMIISCARLMRIDFTAAGTLLNWVTAREAEGRQVQFIAVHRLVGAFFNVVGISEHARVAVRSD